MLEIEQLNAYYGSAQALFGVSVVVPTGQVVLLRGLNGSGKSTLLKSVIGMEVRVDASAGAIALFGQDLRGLASHLRARSGMGYVAEERRLFTDLTVLENLRIAPNKVLSKSDARALESRVLDLFPVLKTMLHRSSSHMSGGEQQMLAIARTLMTAPKVLLLDEPLEGIAPVLVEIIVQALQQLKTQGITMLIAEQHRAVDALADKIVTLVSGKVVPA